MQLGLLTLKRQKPIIRYGIFVIIIIIWYSLIYSPLNAKIELIKTEIQQQKLKIKNTNRRIRRLSNIEKMLNRERQELASLKRLLVKGDTIQMVATNIQDAFLKAASKVNVNVLVYRSGSPRKWRQYQLAVSIFNIKADIKQFVELLERIYAQKRLQRLNNVNISTIKKGKENSELRINMEIEALFLGEKAKHE